MENEDGRARIFEQYASPRLRDAFAEIFMSAQIEKHQ
jgi:hypothetical protein